MDAEDSDSQPEIGFKAATVKLKDEKLVEEAIKQGMARANENTSVRSGWDMVSQFAPSDRRRFQSIEHLRQTFKEQTSRLKSKKNSTDRIESL